MAFDFAADDLDRIAGVLGVPVRSDGTLHRFELTHAPSGRRIALEVRTAVELPAGLTELPPNVVSVYTQTAFLQLPGCTGFIASDELGEVIFFARRGGTTSGLVVEREAGCSLYAHVDERLLNADFTRLPPELASASIALSLTETLFSDLG
ncbi:MAG: hypothetical protein LCH53_10070 [Bacteroidetes bacterium]|nr:hypothetical protein [Bacteroidota bacterium]